MGKESIRCLFPVLHSAASHCTNHPRKFSSFVLLMITKGGQKKCRETYLKEKIEDGKPFRIGFFKQNDQDGQVEGQKILKKLKKKKRYLQV